MVKTIYQKAKKLNNSCTKIIDTENMVVYQGRVLHFGYINIRIIIYKIDNIKRVIMKYEGDNKLQKVYDVSQCKNKKAICKLLDDTLFSKYYYEAYGVIV